jgi:EAL domain-containing protein (putative c-di-GMP-specific phosphodiesterase class I)
VTSRVARLRDIGFRIAVDDIGAGYAGLSSIAQLEPDVVKIDMAMVRHIDVEPTKQKLVSAMAKLCQEMNVRVIAEGVETTAERDTLAALGCDLMQGYFFARPSLPFPEARF